MKFHQELDQDTFYWMTSVEDLAIYNCANKKGCIKHKVGMYIATILHSKQRPKPTMMFGDLNEQEDLTKLVKLTPFVQSIIVELFQSRYIPKSLETSPKKPPAKKARIEVKDKLIEIDLT